MDWNVAVELAEPAVAEERATELLEFFDGYHPAVSAGYRNRPSVTITLPAENLRQALTTAVALVEAAGGSPVYVEVMTTDEFDVRAGFVPVPKLTSASDAGEYLGVSRVRVNQMIDEGRFPSAQKVGNTYVIPTEAIWQNARLHTMIGWSNVNLKEEHIRQVVDPLLDALRLVGPLAAFNAALAVEREESVSSSLAHAWNEAERDALHAMAMLGYDVTGVRFTAQRTGTQLGSR
jgi:hypothetical protein